MSKSTPALKNSPVSRSADPLSFVRGLAPRIRELAGAAEAVSEIPAEITDALYDEGIYSLMIPTALGGGYAGGEEAPPALIIDVLEELSAADGSTGWAVMAPMSGMGTLLAILPDDGVDRVLHSGNYRTAGQIAPTGTAVKVEGGYRISGRFTFASGSPTANWFTGGFWLKDEDGEFVPGPSGPRQLVLGLVPRSGTSLDGGWDVLGFRATASVDYSFPEQFLPEELVTDGAVKRGDTFHRGGVRLLTAIGHASVIHGIIRSSLEAFQKLSLEKRRAPNGGLLATHETVQRDFAIWKSRADSAKAFTYRAFETVYDVLRSGGTPTAAQEADCRMAATQAAYLAPQLTQAVYLMSGSEGLRNSPDNVIQRAFRDAHAASQHALTAEYVYVEAGRIYLDTPGMEETHYRILDHIFAPPLR